MIGNSRLRDCRKRLPLQFTTIGKFRFRLQKWNPPNRLTGIYLRHFAGMAELADALDLGSSAARRAGSSPVPGTT
jgi:hypothetical protein